MQEQFPATPQSVKEWNAKVRKIRRDRAKEQVAEGMSRELASLVSMIGPLKPGEKPLVIPDNVLRDYAAYVAEWNRVVEARRKAAQTRINAREVANVRNAACPRCYSTHAGEC